MKTTHVRYRKILRALSTIWLLTLPSTCLLWTLAHGADDSTCARVKLEIKQELTLERQAFDAQMRITNGLSHVSLRDVNISVNFLDEQRRPVQASSDPSNTGALFFIRLSSMENIGDVSGSGSVEPSSNADIHWLIIPAPGAANGAPQGTLYFVGATLAYTVGGEEQVTEVTPDYIYVKPLPRIALDYFLPGDVYGDDAFTPGIEPPVPFSLGVRVSNHGAGVARKLKISSAQPKIVENQQGLLIGFVIEGSEANGSPVAPSLLVDFGDIEPNASAVARWTMSCTLSGRFVEFKADYTHSDELGGELTSLLEDPVTHLLVRDVVVDLPGRDKIRDFLAMDGAGSYTVYESGKIDTPVSNLSASSTLTGAGTRYTLATPVTAGFIVVKLSDPNEGQKTINEVIRSDGKRIKPENAWLARTRVGGQPWQHFFSLFDASTTGSYTVTFGEAAAHGPILEFVPDRTGLEGQPICFVVQASDPDGTIRKLSAEPL
ncbi:MAG: calcium-binding protein, partial [Deltaproteobacteria bacterium]